MGSQPQLARLADGKSTGLGNVSIISQVQTTLVLLLGFLFEVSTLVRQPT